MRTLIRPGSFDLALLFAAEEMDLAPNVDTVCLPDPSEHFEADENCFATTW
jgi:hypothetical protein